MEDSWRLGEPEARLGPQKGSNEELMGVWTLALALEPPDGHTVGLVLHFSTRLNSRDWPDRRSGGGEGRD